MGPRVRRGRRRTCGLPWLGQRRRYLYGMRRISLVMTWGMILLRYFEADLKIMTGTSIPPGLCSTRTSQLP